MLVCATLPVALALVWLGTRPRPQAAARTAEQRAGGNALSHLAREFRQTTYDAISLLNRPGQPLVVSLLRASDATDSGRLVWEEKVLCYSWDRAGQRLIYREWPPGPKLAAKLSEAAPTRLPEHDLLLLAGLPPTQVLAQGVTAMDVEHSGGRGPDVSGPVTVSLELQGPQGMVVKMRQTLVCPLAPKP